MNGLVGRFGYFPRQQMLALEKYANSLLAPKVHPTRRRSRRRRIAFHLYDLDFSLKEAKLTIAVNLRRRSGCWYVRFTIDGKQWERSTGESDRDKALCKISEIVKEVSYEATYGSKVKDKPLTLLELAKEYTDYSKAHKEDSTHSKEASKMKHILEAFGNHKLSQITPRDIERYMERRKQTAKPATANREFSLLRHMLSKAVDWDYLKNNPAKRVKPFKEPPGRTRFLSQDECERLLDACKYTQGLYEIALTALLTGMRKGKLMGLTWDNIDLERMEITLRKTKNNETRVIPIAEDLLPVLSGLKAKTLGLLVFTRPDGTPYGDPHHRFERVCKLSGIEDFRFHDLRHTFASYLAMAGHSAFTIQRLTGHKTIAMAQRYTHLSESHTRAAIDQLGAKVVQSEDGLDGQSHKLRNYDAPVAQ